MSAGQTAATEPSPTSGPGPTSVAWPRNEGALPDTSLELWWVASRLRAGDRDLAALFFTFRPGPETVLSNAILTDLASGEEIARRNALARADVTLTEGRVDVATPTGSYRGSFSEGYRVSAQIDDSNGFELHARPQRPILFNCGTGEFPMDRSRTGQYSIGGTSVTGSVRMHGEAFDVTGAGWYDRQWHLGERSPDEAHFTWFGIWLDNGDTISLWDRTVEDPRERSWATISRADGTHVIAAVEPVAGSASGSVETSLGHEVPAGWRVEIPGAETTLELSHRPLQDDPTMSFFTGVLDVEGTCRGESVGGSGFSDLVGWWTL